MRYISENYYVLFDTQDEDQQDVGRVIEVVGDECRVYWHRNDVTCKEVTDKLIAIPSVQAELLMSVYDEEAA